MAEIVRRRSWGGVLPLGRHVSISGSSFIQCASASIAPPHPGGAKCYPGAEVQGRTGPRGYSVDSVRETLRDSSENLSSGDWWVVFVDEAQGFGSHFDAMLKTVEE